jgi:hypothetical protein
VLTAALLALLPFLVAKTPLRNSIVTAALPSDQVRVSIGDASLSWFSGPALSNVEIRDAAGELLLTAERISLDRAPGSLLLNPRDLGNIEIIRPTVHLTIRPDGSNWEDIAGRLLTDLTGKFPDESELHANSRQLAFAVRVVEGTILAEDLARSRKWRIEHADLQYSSGSAKGDFGRGKFAAQIVDAVAAGVVVPPPGRIEASLELDDAGRQQLTWRTENLTLALAEPWLRRAVVASEMNGMLSSRGTATWTVGGTALPADFATSGSLSVDRLDASAPILNGDRLRLLRVEVPWRLVSRSGGVRIEDLQLRSEIGNVAVRGALDTAAFSRSPTLVGGLTNSAARHDAELRGVIDIARLAAMLPRALHVRADTTITSGTIDIACRCQPAGTGQFITGSCSTAQLVATNTGRPVHWQNPVTANFALARENGAARLDALTCDSDFLQIAANGTPQQFSATASFDLNRLAQQLGQFLDLSRTNLAGTGEAKLSWTQAGNDGFTAQANGSLSQLQIAFADGGVWIEPQLEVAGTATGGLDPTSRRPNRVDAAQLNLVAQGDELDARLASSVDLASRTPSWPISVKATGRIARWLTRARPWFAPGEWQIDGASELVANVRISGTAFEARDSKLSVSDLVATGPGWNIHEPRFELAGDVRWNGAAGELASTSAQLVTSTVSLAIKDVQYRANRAALTANAAQLPSVTALTGVAAFRADLSRLATWRTSTESQQEYLPQGAFTGNIRFAQQDGRITGELTARGENLALTQTSRASRGAGTTAQQRSALAGQRGSSAGYQTVWQEPELAIRGVAAYDSAADRLDFNQLQIQSNTLQASVSGQIQHVSTAAEANVSGTLNYDLAQITPLLRPYLGNGIQLTGRDQARFALAGSLAASHDTPLHAVSFSAQSAIRNPKSEIPLSRRVRGQLELPWSGANLYGLPVGAGRVAAVLGDGAIRIEPLSLAVGEGRLTVAPHVRLDPEPRQLTLPAGPVISNVRISPEVSEAMLKYVAPVLAGATQSEGLFSLEVAGASVPLSEPRQADSTGKLTVHSVQVVPGPLANQWINLAQQIESLTKRRSAARRDGKSPVTLLAVRDQQVNFRVVDGRVHHENMDFQVGDVAMRSSGSVGFDETIALTLQVPIQDAWIAKEPLLAGFKGQTLEVPISGTLTQPRMDERAIASLGQQLLQGAAQQAIGGELNKALDKLFKSR